MALGGHPVTRHLYCPRRETRRPLVISQFKSHCSVTLVCAGFRGKLGCESFLYSGGLGKGITKLQFLTQSGKGRGSTFEVAECATATANDCKRRLFPSLLTGWAPTPPKR